jgi:hypothetical protein
MVAGLEWPSAARRTPCFGFCGAGPVADFPKFTIPRTRTNISAYHALLAKWRQPILSANPVS